MDLNKQLQKRLKALMKQERMLDSQRRVAAASQVAQSSVNRILNNTQSATLDMVSSLAKAFKIKPDRYLLLDEEEAKKLQTKFLKGRFTLIDYSKQLNKIETGLKEFQKRNIKIRSFFAPNHIYDNNTLNALKESGIKIIIDGYGLFPYFRDEILFIPQLFYREIILPFGIQSTQIHINYWNKENFENFEKFIEKNHNKIVSLDYIIDVTNPNIFQNLINYFVEKSLKTIRVFK